MRLLHTADWHLGQLFYEQDRTEEHQAFLDWLLDTLESQRIDALLISGDIFDVPSPSVPSTRQFYTFLKEATRRMPQLQIIATAGNHDSGPRLEMPSPLLESSTVYLIGGPEKKEDGSTHFEKLLIPLYNRERTCVAYCMAVPFLRMGDYPIIQGAEESYQAGIEAFYQQAADYAKTRLEPHQALLGMGHLHAVQAVVTELDQNERSIMGGLEGISAQAFDPRFCYVALGHIHKAQAVGGREEVRYSGSPIPMSFSERNYQHQVVVLELEGPTLSQMSFIDIPVRIPLLRIPEFQPLPETKVLEAINELEHLDRNQPKPYLEVRVLVEGPEPGLKYRIENALEGKHVQLVKITVSYSHESEANLLGGLQVFEDPKALQPQEVLRRAFLEQYGTEIPDEVMACFNEIVQQVNQPDLP
jgi:exonuclease SbcD